MIAPNSTGAGLSRSAWQESFLGRPGVLAAFVWGLAEATFFFVIPDVFLSFVAILGWPRTRNTFSRRLLERFSVAPCSFTGQAQIRPQLVLPWFVFPSSAKICLRRRMTAFAIRACFRCCLAPSLASPTSFTRWKPRNLRAGQNFFWRLRRHARFASFWSGPALARPHLG